ncbi:hypothetical protein RHMOL_Rhmol05G0207800 [Rhododendron molle]|uniref:Uncharacterized protein n=1 Tax=Rhododendron molle TaxID=49168 RepID=A0ACC0NTR4_RHOML|nr:hypothetical protein RHMOL_Rhmol05G0207800 [Rhododendron molle]
MDENRANALDMPKIMKASRFKSNGWPFSLSFPPGTVIRVGPSSCKNHSDNMVHDVAVSFIHCSASYTKSWCVSENTSAGVSPSLFLFSLSLGGVSFFTSCINQVIWNQKDL